MVYEFPKLQGHVGNLMAQYEGEDKKVSQAIEEHYLPRYAGDSVPETKTGLTLAFIDRLDSLQETFRLGLQPKGSGDPLGLRRASNGIISLLLKAEWNVSLTDVFADPALVKFVTARMKAQFHDEFGGDIISAVLSCTSSDPVGIYHRCQALKRLSNSASFPETRTTFKRLMGLSKDHKSTDYDPSRFVDDSERTLHTHFQEISECILPLEGRNEYSAVLEELIKLKPSIDHLFDSVMVMDSDLEVRNNRLSLLRSISTRFLNIADFTFIN
jgi:glycyl-tRNA synthetase beta chain